ncbi:MAG TPA: hypothetical protein DCG75_07205 [Bacteroidales bacterium]|jgi:HPt (histidine-containing phosphotransfer) domain-containing protein|nr:hypothetical protein [Bacteroidales bacterium]
MDDKNNLIDLTYLNEISDGSNELIHDLIHLFFVQIPEYQAALNDLHDKKDWFNLGRMAHKAKAAILMVGMQELAQELKKLEENAKEEKNIHEYKEIIVKFVRDSNAAIKELQEIKNKL